MDTPHLDPQRAQAHELVIVLASTMRTLLCGVRSSAHGSQDLTPGQFFALSHLAKQQLRISELAERMSVTRPTMTAMVDALVRRHYLERVSDPEDRRSVRLILTPEGQQVHALWQEWIIEGGLNLLKSLKPEEKKALEQTLEGLRRFNLAIAESRENQKS